MKSHMNMINFKILPTSRIILCLTLLYHQLASGTYSAGKQQNDDSPVSGGGCTYTYPKYTSSIVKFDMISCRNTAINDLPVFDNVTKMELIKVPLSVLNRTEIPTAIQSDRVDLRQLYWTKSEIRIVQSVPIPTLNELDLSGNVIQEIREEAFEPLSSLYKLNISNNSIHSLPEKLFAKFYPLRSFSLSHNKLKTLPGDIFDNLRDLEILDLSHNELNYLRENTFANNGKLLYLYLNDNQLNNLPAKIFHPLTSLGHLFLQNNMLIHLDYQTFSTLYSLMILDIGKNPIWNLPNTLLPTNNTLFILTISHTKMANIHPCVFQNLRNLRKLYLSENRNLQNLPNDTFSNSENLKIIDLQNNNFTQLPHSIVNLIPDELLLDGNPWPCDCTMQWIINWIKSLGESRNNVRLSSYCNSTDRDLIETVHRMQCKPTIIRVSPVSYQQLEVKVQLVCRAYANPRPLISWVTPNGLAYIKSESALDLLRYHPTFDMYPHLQNSEGNVHLFENGDLVITSMTRDDAGEYLCIATNKVGEAFAPTRLHVDPTIMQRIKTGSIICGLLWINGFLVFSVVYILLRKCTKRAKEQKKKRRMHENMDIYKSQQISKLRERCKNQMNRIKNNCSTQVEWMKENYMESLKNTSEDRQNSHLTAQYNEQMSEIREYYLTQMHKIREHYGQQRNLILEFSVNKNIAPEMNLKPCRKTTSGDILVKMENGNISSASINVPEEDIYKYNDVMKNEIKKLTSLRNLHEVLLDGDKIKTMKCEYTERNNHFDFIPKILKDELRKSDHENGMNGKLKMSPECEEDEDENTTMLPTRFPDNG